MKIATIIGARPQFIKAALLSGNIKKDRSGLVRIREVFINTGQHYDYNMSKKFFEELNIPAPDYDLNIGSAPRAAQIAGMMKKIEAVLKKEKPEAVLVYGDTNSTLAGALVASSLNIPLCHIEAGLRSYDLSMPEESNRVITDRLSKMLFCPTLEAVKNLKKESIIKGVYMVGDIMYELARKTAKIASARSSILSLLGIVPKRYTLATVHRQANTDIRQNLKSIIDAFQMIDDVIVFPVHPRTEKMLKRFGLWSTVKKMKNVKMIPPVGYVDMICLEKNAAAILTDSGGVQKEAYFFKVPCITLRDNTEWVETVKSGWNTLAGADTVKIIRAYKRLKARKAHPDYYGDGNTSKRIIGILKKEGPGK